MYFIGYLSLEGLLKTHRDEKSPIYLAPWGAPGGDPLRDPRVLAADMQDGFGRYCLMTETEAAAFTGTAADCESIKKRIKSEFHLSVEDAVLSLPTHYYLQVAGGGTLLPGDTSANPPAIPMPDVDERGRARYEAIRPLLDAPARTTAAVRARAKELNIGASTLYAWLNRYDPKVGAASLSGSRRRRVPSPEGNKSGASGDGGAQESSDGPPGPAYWLRVSSPDNWIADKVAQFRIIGVEDQKRPLAALAKPGDIVITYVKGRGFADLRRVKDGGLISLDDLVAYTDGDFPFALRTEPVTVLPFDKHVPVGSLNSAGSTSRVQLRNPLQQLAPGEGMRIEEVLRARAAA